MNIKQHIEAGHYECDSSGRALVPLAGCDAIAVVCATDKPGRYPILGWAPTPARIASIEFAWDEDGHASGKNEFERLLPPPPRKVEVKAVARVTDKINIHYCQPDNPANRAEVSANVMQYGGQMVLLTGSYEEGWIK